MLIGSGLIAAAMARSSASMNADAVAGDAVRPRRREHRSDSRVDCGVNPVAKAGQPGAVGAGLRDGQSRGVVDRKLVASGAFETGGDHFHAARPRAAVLLAHRQDAGRKGCRHGLTIAGGRESRRRARWGSRPMVSAANEDGVEQPAFALVRQTATVEQEDQIGERRPGRQLDHVVAEDADARGIRLNDAGPPRIHENGLSLRSRSRAGCNRSVTVTRLVPVQVGVSFCKAMGGTSPVEVSR